MGERMVEPNITHFHQYPIQAVGEADNDSWYIEFQGGGRIEMKGTQPKKDITGMSVLTSILTEEGSTAKVGLMKVGEHGPEPDYILDVELKTGEYTITDPRYDAIPVMPVLVEAEHNDERAAEAPEPPSEDDEEPEQPETAPDDETG